MGPPLGIWLALGVLAGIGMIGRWVRRRKNSNKVDVGSVSDQWIAEHRAGQNDGPIR
jgi:hypothetical protein